MEFSAQQQRASDWFNALRDQIVAAFEGLESEAGSDARFEVTPTSRDSGGGGRMSGAMRFTKAGVVDAGAE